MSGRTDIAKQKRMVALFISTRYLFSRASNWSWTIVLIHEYWNAMKLVIEICFMSYRDGKKSHLWRLFSSNPCRFYYRKIYLLTPTSDMQNAILTYFYHVCKSTCDLYVLCKSTWREREREREREIYIYICIYVIMEHIDANLQFNDVDILHVSITLSLALIILLYTELKKCI